MGRFLRKMKKRINDFKEKHIENQEEAQRAFEDQKPDKMKNDVRMISGCEDHQTSADVSSVDSFQLPDPAGRAGGACTSTLLRILYKDETVPEDKMSFTEVLDQMRVDLKKQGFTQIPQLTSSNPIDVNTDFDLVPPTATGTRRVCINSRILLFGLVITCNDTCFVTLNTDSYPTIIDCLCSLHLAFFFSSIFQAVMIGINYVGHDPGELRGCHNDVLNMVSQRMKGSFDALSIKRCIRKTFFSHLDSSPP